MKAILISKYIFFKAIVECPWIFRYEWYYSSRH